MDQAHGEGPWKELPRMRVSGELQVEAGLLGQRRDLRIVCKQESKGLAGFGRRREVGARRLLRVRAC
jgi:hypothetical protein